MKESQEPFSSEESEISRRFQLFKYIVGVVVLGVILGGAWLQHQATSDWKRGQEKGALKAKLNQEALIRFVNNATEFDFYKFSVNKKLSTGEFTRNIELESKVEEVASDYLSIQFKQGVVIIDTITVEKRELLKVIRGDTIELQIDGALFLVNAINSYSRSDGPGLKISSFSKDAVTLVKRAGALEITSIESLVGEAKMDESFSFGQAEERFTVGIEREKGSVEFILKGITSESAHWSRRVIIRDWDSFLFVE